MGGRTVGGPTVGDGLVFATRGKKGPLLAVRPDGDGELKDKSVVWTETKDTPDSCSPVCCKDLLFCLVDAGFAYCYDAHTGDLKWKERLPGEYKASPVAADGRIYFLNRAGACTVIAASGAYEKLASNSLDGDTNASPAVADGRIYIRTSKALYCIGAEVRAEHATSPSFRERGRRQSSKSLADASGWQGSGSNRVRFFPSLLAIVVPY